MSFEAGDIVTVDNGLQDLLLYRVVRFFDKDEEGDDVRLELVWKASRYSGLTVGKHAFTETKKLLAPSNGLLVLAFAAK